MPKFLTTKNTLVVAVAAVVGAVLQAVVRPLIGI